jgi:hypothetical protein
MILQLTGSCPKYAIVSDLLVIFPKTLNNTKYSMAASLQAYPLPPPPSPSSY